MPETDDAPKPNAAQMASPSYRLAALDPDFLLGESMRGVRFMLEFEKADQALKAWHVRSTIVVFGSARVRENGGPSELAMPYDAAAGEVGVAWPQVLPGGKMLLYRSRKNTKEDDYTIVGWEIESRVRHTVTNGIIARFLQESAMATVPFSALPSMTAKSNFTSP